ncbi:MAG TPA: hypothetical protein VJ838_02680 [Gaiellaceae bacterium]|nr:hypothetical protein [Gaiellaceae bacterium]
MRRFIVLLFVVIASAFTASQASANTRQFVSMTFAEPIHPSTTCPGFPDVACGSGEVIPLGQASEIIVFGAGCGGTCDLRTITLAGGSLILEETGGGATCPAGDVCRPGPLELGRGTFTDVFVGGTGIYEGATGTLTGTVKLEGSNGYPSGTSTVKLSGTIQYGP